MLPFVSALAVGCFLRAWHGTRYRQWVWAGFWFGVALYTYTSATFYCLYRAFSCFAKAA